MYIIISRAVIPCMVILPFPHRSCLQYGMFTVWEGRGIISRSISSSCECAIRYLIRLDYFTFFALNCYLLLNCLDHVSLLLLWFHARLCSLSLYTSCVICIWCLARSLDLTLFWCLGPDHDPTDDAYYEAPVVGDYEWGSVDQVVEPDDGAPAQGEWL